MTWERMRTIGLILFGLLAMSAVIIVAGRRTDTTWPSIASSSPSGTAALSELLQKRGWEVGMDRSPTPEAEPGELIISYLVDGPEMMAAAEEDQEDSEGEAAKVDTSFEGGLIRQAQKGATVLVLPLAREFDNESRAVKSAPAVSSLEKSRKFEVTTGDYILSSATMIANRIPQGRYYAYTNSQGPFVMGTQVGKGSIWIVRDGIGSTNRFLDQKDNAAFYMDLIRRLNSDKQKIIFAEAGFGNTSASGLLAVWGPWASAAWWQAVLLLIVVIFTLSRRFGQPEIDPPVERTTRDLLIAAGQAMLRGKHIQLALDMLYTDAMDRTRNAFGALQIENDATVLNRLPQDLAISLKAVGGMSAKEAKRHQIVAAVARMEYQVNLHSRSVRGRRTRA